VRSLAKAVRLLDDRVRVDLSDGRVIAVPLAWFPLLMSATPEQLAHVGFSSRGLHCEGLEVGTSVDGLLAGTGHLARKRQFYELTHSRRLATRRSTCPRRLLRVSRSHSRTLV
jgi:Protein of unknown function (DUF2442)